MGHDETLGEITEVGDADLVVRTRAGDADAFGELWRRHYRSGVVVARSVTDQFDADDLVQESYTKIFRSIARGGGPTGSFRAYLFTSIRNTAAAWGRARSESSLDTLDRLEDPSTTERATEAALDRSLTHRAFRGLPSRWQEVLWYAEIEQMKPSEIAPLMGLGAGAVSQLLFRAREGLRESWIRAHLLTVADRPECAWTVEHLGAFARENLSRRDRRRLDAHLVACARCTIVASEAREVSGRLALILLPLALGSVGASAYLATLQGGGVPLTALAAGSTLAAEGAALAEGVVVAPAAAASTTTASASGVVAAGAGAGSATVGAIGTVAAGSGVTSALGLIAASVVVVGGVLAGGLASTGDGVPLQGLLDGAVSAVGGAPGIDPAAAAAGDEAIADTTESASDARGTADGTDASDAAVDAPRLRVLSAASTTGRIHIALEIMGLPGSTVRMQFLGDARDVVLDSQGVAATDVEASVGELRTRSTVRLASLDRNGQAVSSSVQLIDLIDLGSLLGNGNANGDGGSNGNGNGSANGNGNGSSNGNGNGSANGNGTSNGNGQTGTSNGNGTPGVSNGTPGTSNGNGTPGVPNENGKGIGKVIEESVDPDATDGGATSAPPSTTGVAPGEPAPVAMSMAPTGVVPEAVPTATAEPAPAAEPEPTSEPEPTPEG